ncbi:transferrin-binding protein-like solute binding protein [Haemophilus influenzae]
MTINLTKFSLTILVALTLTACGSSGGSGDSQSAHTPSTSIHTQNNSTPNKNTSTPPVNVSNANNLEIKNNDKTGGAFIISEEDGHVTLKKVDITTNSDLNVLYIDGTKIPLSSPSIKSNGWLNIRSGTGKVSIDGIETSRDLKVCCGKYTDTRIGKVLSKNKNEDTYFFYNGNLTRNMPVGGTVNYNTGDSILSSYHDELGDTDEAVGTSQFSADFVNKKLTGSLSVNEKKLNINADISGNTFSGTTQSDAFKSQGIAEGKFYGENAKELGGLVKANDNSWSGAFAAKK